MIEPGPPDPTEDDPLKPTPSAIDLTDLSTVPGSGGVVWSASPAGAHVNLVVLDAGQSIGEHVNDSVDVVMITLAGSATLHVDDTDHELSPQRAVLVPRGARRGVSAGSPGVRYLSIHTERPPLDLTPRRRT